MAARGPGASQGNRGRPEPHALSGTILASGFALCPRSGSPGRPCFFPSGPAGEPAFFGFFTHGPLAGFSVALYPVGFRNGDAPCSRSTPPNPSSPGANSKTAPP